MVTRVTGHLHLSTIHRRMRLIENRSDRFRITLLLSLNASDIFDNIFSTKWHTFLLSLLHLFIYAQILHNPVDIFLKLFVVFCHRSSFLWSVFIVILLRCSSFLWSMVLVILLRGCSLLLSMLFVILLRSSHFLWSKSWDDVSFLLHVNVPKIQHQNCKQDLFVWQMKMLRGWRSTFKWDITWFAICFYRQFHQSPVTPFTPSDQTSHSYIQFLIDLGTGVTGVTGNWTQSSYSGNPKSQS